MDLRQTYLKDCNCTNAGIIIINDIAYCRWCCVPYGMGGQISYPNERFESKQPTKDKEYEILSFKQNSYVLDLWTKFDNGWCRNHNGKPITNPYKLEDILSNQFYKIHSVRRLSDNEVFTIGDKINYNGGDGKSIASITILEIIDNDLRIYITSLPPYSPAYLIRQVSEIQKVEDKTPIITDRKVDKEYVIDIIHYNELHHQIRLIKERLDRIEKIIVSKD